MMVTTIDEYARRPKRAFEADGLVDMALGFALFGMAFMSYASVRQLATLHGSQFWMSQAYRDANNLFLVSIFVMNGMLVGALAAVAPLKRRFVYPRLGYFAPRVVPRSPTIPIVIAVGLGGLALLLLLTGQSKSLSASGMLSPLIGEASTVSVGVLGAIFLAAQFARFGFVRHLIVAITSIVASVLLFSAHMGKARADMWFYLILGTVMIVSGALPFSKLLRIPIPTDGSPE